MDGLTTSFARLTGAVKDTDLERGRSSSGLSEYVRLSLSLVLTGKTSG